MKKVHLSLVAHRFAVAAALWTLVLATACTEPARQATPYDDEFPVSAHDPLFEGAPAKSELPDENKSDAIYPAISTALLASQSPVKSQGSRGVCSIFSAVALMEHLYIKQGNITNPDFSEQYLQWSAKFEQNSFPNTSGSNSDQNLKAISRFGIVTEAVWPYEKFQWGVANDPACDGTDEQPTLCYTNGHPSDEIKQAPKFKLPSGRWLNTNSIKAHITTKGTGVVVGMTFFYQAWNHRLSTLPVNSEYWRLGYVTYPNAEDEEASLEKRAGHSILLVGWDDNLEVAARDKDGNPVLDGDGNPVIEKGFYIFKNSWGTGSFGVNNAHGDGYGYISMRYINEYASAYVSDIPVLAPLVEVCDDGADNNHNGATDCDDAACTNHASCQASENTFTYDAVASLAIPDNNATGVSNGLTAADAGAIASLSVSVNIAHPYRGDLKVWLEHNGVQTVLHDRTGSYQDNLIATYDVSDFNGAALSGTWTLHVADTAAYDTGTLVSWRLEGVTQ